MQHVRGNAPVGGSLPRLDCESSQVAGIVAEIANLVVSTGGYLLDQLTIREQQGQVSAHVPRAAEGLRDRPTLIVLKATAMPSVSTAKWSWAEESLQVVTDPDQNSIGNQLLELHAQLYTVTGKPRWFLAEHPRATIAPGSATHIAIQGLKPLFTPDTSPRGLLDTRTLGRGNQRTCSLIPIAELLNHHPQGAPFLGDGDQLRVRAHQPTSGTECFTNYGELRRDPLDLALHYGYADSAAQEATSAPLHVEVDGFGEVRVERQLPRPSSLLDPPTVQRTKDGPRLSHLTIQAEQPDRLLVPLTMIAKASGAAHAERAARELVGAVVDRNLALLEALEATLDKDSPMGAMLAEACGYQAAIFRSVGAAVA